MKKKNKKTQRNDVFISDMSAPKNSPRQFVNHPNVLFPNPEPQSVSIDEIPLGFSLATFAPWRLCVDVLPDQIAQDFLYAYSSVAVKTGKKRVLIWNQRWAWERVFRRLLADKITDAVIAEVKRTSPQYISDGYFTWLNTLVATVTHQSPVDIPTFLAARLANYYDYVVAFHGTRSDSAADFLARGIMLSDRKVLEQRALERFGDNDAVKKAIVELRQSGYEWHNHGKIFLSLTKAACVNEHDHYMLHGSEYLATIANRLGQGAEFETVGKPLIVECLIPRSALDSEFWRGRSFAMLEDYFTRLLHPSERRQVHPSCVVVTQPIPAENILRVHEFAEFKRTDRWDDFETNEPKQFEETRLRPLKIWDGLTQL
jgi:hypothetical protein